MTVARRVLLVAWGLPHVLIATYLTPEPDTVRFMIGLVAMNLLPVAGVALLDLFGLVGAALGWLAGIGVAAWAAFVVGFLVPQGDQASLVYLFLPWVSMGGLGPVGAGVGLVVQRRLARRRATSGP